MRLRDQIRNVFAPIQEASNGGERIAAARRVPLREGFVHFDIELPLHAFEALAQGPDLFGVGFLEGHIELKNFFQQLGRNIFCALFSDVEAFQLQQILGAGDRIAQSAVGVVENGSRFLRLVTLRLGLARMQIGVKLTAQCVEAGLQIFGIEREFPLYAERLEIAAHAEKDVPQPQLFFAFGFSNTKPDCMSDSL